MVNLRINYNHDFEHTRETIWDFLQDEDVLKKTLPGCRTFEEIEDNLYNAELGLDIGPVKGSFEGEVRLSEQQEPESYRLLLKGKGKPGEVNADALITLKENGDGTIVSCEADVQVTGVLAGVGQRVMGSVAKLILGRFFKAVAKEMDEAA